MIDRIVTSLSWSNTQEPSEIRVCKNNKDFMINIWSKRNVACLEGHLPSIRCAADVSYSAVSDNWAVIDKR